LRSINAAEAYVAHNRLMANKHKHAVIVGHPSAASFALSVAQTYQQAAEACGKQVILRDLYRLGFDPRLQSEEIPRPAGFAPSPEVAAERALLADVDVFCFVYPLWFNAPPAIIAGYIQRVFGMGFGFGSLKQGANQRLLLGRSMISFSSSGAPAEWLRTEGSWDALKNLFDQHVADVCGITLLDHRHYGRVLNATPASRIEAHLKDVRDTVQRHFGAVSL
jgi:NAD(P)H dehydrogenase (quinone)